MEKYNIKVHNDFVKELFDTNNMYNIKQFNVDDDDNIQSIEFVDRDGNVKTLEIRKTIFDSICSTSNKNGLVYKEYCEDNFEIDNREDNTEICDQIRGGGYNEVERNLLLAMSNCVIKSPSTSKKSNMMLIIGAGVGGVVLIGIIIFLIIYLRRR